MAVGRAPISSRNQFAAELIEEYGTGSRLHAEVTQHYDSLERYCGARTPRTVVPINLPRDEQVRRGMAPRDFGPPFNPVYSDELDGWMQAALIMEPDKRVTVGRLLRRMVPDARWILRQIAGSSGLVDLDVTF